MNIQMRTRALAAATMLGIVASANATLFVLAGTSNASGDALSATADFTCVGNVMTIVLTNTQATASTNGADVLGGLYFDLAGAVPNVVDINVSLGGSTFELKDGGTPGATNPLSHEWMYKSPAGGSFGTMYALGSTGFPGFNTNQDTINELFEGGSASAGANDDYGIIPVLGMTAGNSSNVYVNNALTFEFVFDDAIVCDVLNVHASYGSNGQTVITPEPATMAAIGLGALAMLRKRRKA